MSIAVCYVLLYVLLCIVMFVCFVAVGWVCLCSGLVCCVLGGCSLSGYGLV